jgi:hypothetical protein
MTVDAPSAFVSTKPASGGLTRRGLIKTGLGLTGLAGIVLPGTAAYAAMEAANGLSITDYRLTPPGWPSGQRLTIAVVADLHAGGPNMGAARVRQVVDAAEPAVAEPVSELIAEPGQPEAAVPRTQQHNVVFHHWNAHLRQRRTCGLNAVPPVMIAED